MALDLTYDLTNYTPADASPVASNFNRIEQYVNQEVVNRDGSVAMTGQLKLVGDPVANTDATTKAYVDAILPVGIVMQYGGVVVPPGGRWALCDGAVLAAASYPSLFAVIGYAFGGSGGSFNLPNLVGKVPVGAGTGNALGTTGGSRDAVVVNHTHTIDHGHPAGTTSPVSADHTHGMNFNTSAASGNHQHNGTTAGMDRANPHHHDSGIFAFVKTGFDSQVATGRGAPSFGVQTGDYGTGDTDINHAHVFTTDAGGADHVHAVSGNTGGISANHTHTFTPAAMAGPSGPAAGGVAATNANMMPYVVMSSIIRVA